MSNNSINIYGNASGIQIQQGCSNSNQTQENNIMSDADVEKYQMVLDQINKYRPQFVDDFGEKSDALIEALEQAQEALNTRDQSLWIRAIGVVRDLAIGVSGSLLASGILTLIPPM